jgi:hypothetical protein
MMVVDQRTSDCDATPHAAREAAWIKAERLFKAHESQGFVDASVDFVIIYPLLNELVCDVVADGQRIE